MSQLDDAGMMTPREVAALFQVDPKTIARWDLSGRLRATRTVGGHRRFRRSDVRALFAAEMGYDPPESVELTG